jgi:hypothetical protein
MTMIASLRSLQQVAPPPSIPMETGRPTDWPQVSEELGLILPSDYGELVNTYGSGCFLRFLWPLNPFSEDGTLNLAQQAPLLLWAAQEQRRMEPSAVPFPIHPEPGGLFPWARTERGDALYWMTEGGPETWPVVVWDRKARAFARFDRSTTLFLFQWISGVIAPGLAPDAPPRPGPAFLSIAESKRAGQA